MSVMVGVMVPRNGGPVFTAFKTAASEERALQLVPQTSTGHPGRTGIRFLGLGGPCMPAVAC